MRVFILIYCFFSLVGCQQFPYYPEPFSNVSYNRNSEYVGGSDQAYLDFGVTGNRPNPIINTRDIDTYYKVQNAYLIHFMKMSDETALANKAGAHIKDIDDKFKANCKDLVFETKTEDGRVAKTVEREVCTVNHDITWSEITLNGLNYVDAVCEDYLRQLYRLKKNNRGLKNLTENIGSTTGTVLGLTNVVQRTIGLVAAAFGLGTSVFDIYEETVLTVLPYPTVHQFVKRLQVQYRLIVAAEPPTNRARAVHAIQSYLYLCSPAAIESNINNQVANGTVKSLLINAGLLPVAKADTGSTGLAGAQIPESGDETTLTRTRKLVADAAEQAFDLDIRN